MTRFIVDNPSWIPRLSAPAVSSPLDPSTRDGPFPILQDGLASEEIRFSASMGKCGFGTDLDRTVWVNMVSVARLTIRIVPRPNIRKMPTRVATTEVSGSIDSGPK
jgi:hypothetical protein